LPENFFGLGTTSSSAQDQDLKKEFEEQKILGMACDVRDSKSIQALVDMAKSKLGHIDIWVTIISFFSDSNASFHFLCTVLAI
jgi:enoyl-[acyl-carrier-protein] reductase (NADH)